MKPRIPGLEVRAFGLGSRPTVESPKRGRKPREPKTVAELSAELDALEETGEEEAGEEETGEEDGTAPSAPKPVEKRDGKTVGELAAELDALEKSTKQENAEAPGIPADDDSAALAKLGLTEWGPIPRGR